MKFDSKFSMKPNNVNPDSYPSLVDDDDDSHSEPDDNINLGVSSEQISEFCQVIFEFIIISFQFRNLKGIKLEKYNSDDEPGRTRRL